MLRIYLDTNHWITLLKVKQGKESDKELQNLYNTIVKQAQANKIYVLFSVFTLIEIQQRHDTIKREEIIDFVLDTSKLYGLRPYSSFSKYEIENAIEFVLYKRYVHNIYSQILGKGLEIFGVGLENLKLNSESLSSIELDKIKIVLGVWQKLTHNHEFVRLVLKNTEMATIAQNSRKDNEEIINAIEQSRRKNNNLSKDEFYRYTRARHISSLDEHVARLMMSKNIRPEQIFTTQEKGKLFVKHLNSLNVKSLLIYERDISSEKPFTHNDYLDIEHLAGAIPYCDIVVTDKMAAELCRRKKLDEIYNCHILNDLKKLSTYL